VSKTEELLGRNGSGSGLENRKYGRGDPLRRPRDNLYPQKLPVTSPTCGGRSVGIVRLRIKTTEFVFVLLIMDFDDFFVDLQFFLASFRPFPQPPSVRMQTLGHTG
jgi:hypothetical protein